MPYTGTSESFNNTIVENITFYPDVLLGDFQRDYRIPTEYELETVVTHVCTAMIDINAALLEQQTQWEADGFYRLDLVPADQINSESVLIKSYFRALFCKTKYLILQQYKSISVKNMAEHIGRDEDDSLATWLSESTAAINALMGLGHARINAAAI